MALRVAAGLSLLLSIACLAPRAPARSGSMMLARNDRLPPDREEMVCNMEAPTGSHIRRSVCRTAAEVDAKRFATQDSMRFMRGFRTRGGATVVDDFDMSVQNVNNP
jgi:hypothetical protein